MKEKIKLQKYSSFLLVMLVAFLLLAPPTPVMAQTDENDDQIVLGGRFRLHSDETINGNLIILGGAAVLEADSLVQGDVLITGGSLQAAGTINGDVTAVGGSVELMDGAVIMGDINLTSASLARSPGAEVRGNLRQNTGLNAFDIDNLPNIVLPETTNVNPMRTWVNFLASILWWVLRILAIAGLAALVVLIAKAPTDRAAESITNQPVIAFSFGLLTAIVAPALLLLLTITIILIPVGLIGILLLTIAGLFGWVAVGYLIGQRLEKALKQNWAPAISAGIGTLILTIATSIFGLIPCIGWTISALVAIVGLGGVLISRFGTQVYGRNAVATPQQPPRAGAELEADAGKEPGDENSPPFSQSPTE